MHADELVDHLKAAEIQYNDNRVNKVSIELENGKVYNMAEYVAMKPAGNMSHWVRVVKTLFDMNGKMDLAVNNDLSYVMNELKTKVMENNFPLSVDLPSVSLYTPFQMFMSITGEDETYVYVSTTVNQFTFGMERIHIKNDEVVKIIAKPPSSEEPDYLYAVGDSVMDTDGHEGQIKSRNARRRDMGIKGFHKYYVVTFDGGATQTRYLEKDLKPVTDDSS